MNSFRIFLLLASTMESRRDFLAKADLSMTCSMLVGCLYFCVARNTTRASAFCSNSADKYGYLLTWLQTRKAPMEVPTLANSKEKLLGTPLSKGLLIVLDGKKQP